ncbi:MAG: hypothetical protein Q8P11_02750 [bacterium]|nr:hypothetical protein [bacterium]
MTIPWLYIIPIVINTFGLSVMDRFLRTKLKWYRLILMVIPLELFAYFGVAYDVLVASLSFCLILVVLLEVRFSKAFALMLVYAGISIVVNLLLLSRTVLFPFLGQ